MNTKTFLSALSVAALVSPAFAAPILSIIPQGQQVGNWVWEVDVTPDIVAAGGPTPLDVELGFRLTSDPLVSVTNLSPAIFDFNTPGNIIFGWETLYGSPPKPEGIEAKCTACSVTNLAFLGGNAATVVPGSTNEVFSAMGTGVVATATPIPFLRIVALGPGNGGPAGSTIQWLGAYNGKGRIAQAVGATGENFDLYSGSATQGVPEPTSIAMLTLGAITIAAAARRRRSVA
jgi:hypothetical protein